VSAKIAGSANDANDRFLLPLPLSVVVVPVWKELSPSPPHKLPADPVDYGVDDKADDHGGTHRDPRFDEIHHLRRFIDALLSRTDKLFAIT
jgi:hypothetical protein